MQGLTYLIIITATLILTEYHARDHGKRLIFKKDKWKWVLLRLGVALVLSTPMLVFSLKAYSLTVLGTLFSFGAYFDPRRNKHADKPLLYSGSQSTYDDATGGNELLMCVIEACIATGIGVYLWMV